MCRLLFWDIAWSLLNKLPKMKSLQKNDSLFLVLSFKTKATVRASNHQGSPEFSGSGRHCTCNLLINFVHYCSFGSPHTWLQQDQDKSLDLGDTLYEAVAKMNIKNTC